jgi:magnesium transporter
MPSLALFVPLVVALAESMALQSAGLAARAARRTGGTLRGLGKEGLVGAVLGLSCGAVAAGVALSVWAVPTTLALALGGVIGGGMVGAALAGASFPVLLGRWGWDSRVAAGPVARALADVVSVLLYFLLARWLLG